MNKTIFSLSLGLLVMSGTACNAQGSETGNVTGRLRPEPHFKETTQLVQVLLENNAYRKVKLDDETSKNLYQEYLKNTDYAKMYFTQQDINEFEPFKTSLDDQLAKFEVDFAYLVYNRYLDNAERLLAYTDSLLKDSFDYSKDEYYETDPDKYSYAANTKELKERWRKRIKFESLSMLAAGKNWKNTSEELKKRYGNYSKQLKKIKSQDVYDAYMSAFCGLADPHTDYFSPRAAEDFNINSSLSLEGIGATLQTENEYTRIHEIVKGGPADKSGKIFVNDKIIAVAQGKDGEYEDVIGWRIDDVVSKIRGPKGTIVRLKMIDHKSSPGDPPKEVVIVRDKIKLEEQAAKAVMDTVKRDGKEYHIGVIKLPSFYLDYQAMQKGDKDYKSTSNDVRRLIDSLKRMKMDGLILDLRNNGGGALPEAINTSGLFIDKGPVVQVKDTKENIEVDDDETPGKAWDGQLVVLVNRFSASASEILAAALQDYKRALIVGENTHGKGTVQNLVDLDRWGGTEKRGELKLTIAKFYRVNGGSTQVKGVVPDVRFKSVFDSKEYGEDESPYHLPYDEIAKADITADNSLKANIASLNARHDDRMKTNVAYRFLLEDIKDFQKNKEKDKVALQYKKYMEEHKQNQDKKAAREKEKETLKKENKNVDADLILEEGKQLLVDMLLG